MWLPFSKKGFSQKESALSRVVCIFSSENWKWTLLIDLIQAAQPSVGERHRNSESLARGCWTYCAVIDKRLLLLQEATWSLKGVYTSCYMTCFCDRKLCLKALEINNKTFLFLFFFRAVRMHHSGRARKCLAKGDQYIRSRTVKKMRTEWRDKVANKATQVLLWRDVKSKNANENKCAHSM